MKRHRLAWLLATSLLLWSGAACAAKPAKPIVRATAAAAKPGAVKSSALFVASDDFRFGYIDKTGKVIISGYEDAGEYSDGLAAVKIKGQFGYIDTAGKVLIPAKYDFAWQFSEGLASVKIGKSFGYIDKAGKMVIEPKYSDAWEFSEGLAAVVFDAKYGAIDKTGAFVIQPTYEKMGQLSGGLIAVCIAGKWGFIDKTGAIVIDLQFDKADKFVGGLAPAWSGGRCGFIDKTGKWVIEPKYSDELPFSDGLAAVGVQKTDVVRRDGKIIAMRRYTLWGFIDPKGNEVIPVDLGKVGSFSEGLAPIWRYGQRGHAGDSGWVSVWDPDEFSFIDKTGKTVIDPLYNKNTLGFHGGLARTEIGKRYGYINDTGKMVVPQRYTSATPFNEGLAAVQTHPDGAWGYVDAAGKMAIPSRFQSALGFRNGMARVRANYKWGLIDKTGKVKLEPRFDEIAWYTDKVLALKDHNLWGFYDWSGKAFLEPQFQSASFLGDRQAIVKKDGKWGVVDSDGKLTVPATYADSGWLYSQGLLPVTVNGKVGFIDAAGKMVIQPQFDAAAAFTAESLCGVRVGDKWGFVDKTGNMAIAPQYDLAACFSEERAAVKVGDLWGFIDKTGQYVVKPQYADASYFSSGLAPVCTGDKWGYIDKAGKLAVPVKFDRAAAFQNNLAQLRKGRQDGYIDKTGKSIWMSRDYGETVVKAPVSEPPQIDPDGTRVLKVRLAPDQVMQRSSDWESTLQKRVDGASEILKKVKLRLEIVGTTPWESPETNEGEDPDKYGDRMFDTAVEKASPDGSELVLVFTGRPTGSPTLGFTYPFYNRVFIYDERTENEPRRAAVTAHEICHTFGAFHVAAKESLMHLYSLLDVDQSGFDQYNVRQMEVMRDFDHARGIDWLSRDQVVKTSAIFADGHMPGDASLVTQALVWRGLQQVRADLPGAISVFRKAVDAESQSADFMLFGRLGEALLLDGQLVQGVEMLRKAEPLEIEQTKAAKGHRLLGTHLERLFGDDIAFLGCQQQTKPSLAEICERRVRAMISPDEVLTQYREAVEAEPENDYCHYRLGKALLLCGLNEEGLAEYEKAITLKPGDQWYKDQLELAKTQIAATAR